MKNFEFEAWDQAGNRHEGVRQANSEDDVISMLREQGLTPVSIVPIAVTNQKKRGGVRYKRVKSHELSTFCWQLGTMLDGGLPITSAIETISSEMENPYFGWILRTISIQLERGSSLSSCIEAFPRVFNTMARAMIQAGEKGGNLTTTLERLAEYYNNKDKLAKKVRGALAYPIFVVVFIVLIIIALMTFIIPRFTTMFEMMEGKLPAFTRGFMYVYDTILANLVYILVGIAVLVFGFTFYGKTRSGHKRLSQLGMIMPLFGKIKIHAFVSVFCKTLSTLVSSGVPVLEAFEILSNMTNNDVLKTGVLETRERLVEGSSVSDSMAASRFFPDVAIKMTQIGEQSGSLSSVLEKTSQYYERKVDAAISALLGLMEPVLIVSVGAIVLVVILAMYLPIFTMSGPGGG
ncbi:MAG: type II secretion system F family protein [Sedimentisphaerales bacterium]|nr:type II secretion system F family protein [Sedimentisphaerales bacterium]